MLLLADWEHNFANTFPPFNLRSHFTENGTGKKNVEIAFDRKGFDNNSTGNTAINEWTVKKEPKQINRNARQLRRPEWASERVWVCLRSVH